MMIMHRQLKDLGFNLVFEFHPTAHIPNAVIRYHAYLKRQRYKKHGHFFTKKCPSRLGSQGCMMIMEGSCWIEISRWPLPMCKISRSMVLKVNDLGGIILLGFQSNS